MAEHSGVSKSTVQRWFTMFGLQPHRQRYFKLSNDPFFIEKVRDIVDSGGRTSGHRVTHGPGDGQLRSTCRSCAISRRTCLRLWTCT